MELDVKFFNFSKILQFFLNTVLSTSTPSLLATYDPSATSLQPLLYK